MQPSSRRVGGISARSSASKRDSWPGFGRRITTRVTAVLGSLAPAFAAALPFPAYFCAFRLAMIADCTPTFQHDGYKMRRGALPQGYKDNANRCRSFDNIAGR